MRTIEPPSTPEETPEFCRKLQDNVSAALGSLTGLPILDSVYRQRVTLASGLTPVPHTLGRAWRGYVITRCNAPVLPYAPDEQSLRERFCELQASAPCVVDIIFF